MNPSERIGQRGGNIAAVEVRRDVFLSVKQAGIEPEIQGKALDGDAGSKGNPGIERLAHSVSVEEQFGVWSYIRDNVPLVCCRVVFDQGRQPGIYEKVVIFHPSGNAENDIS